MPHFRRTICVVAAALLVASFVQVLGVVQGTSSGLSLPMPDTVLTPSLASDWTATRTALAERIDQDEYGAGGVWRYADGLCLERLGQLEDALYSFTVLERDFPSGPFARKAGFARARILSLLDRHAEASAILKTATLELGGEERRDELARTCSDLAGQIVSAAEVGTPEEKIAALQRSVSVLEEALRLDPSPSMTLSLRTELARLTNHLGLFALEAAHIKQAIDITLALRTGPQSSTDLDRLRIELAEAHARAGQLDTSIDLFARFSTEARGESPSLIVRAQLGRAQALVDRHKGSDLADARALYTDFLEKSADTVERIRIAIALAELIESQGQDSSETWRQAITTNVSEPQQALQATRLIRTATARLGQVLFRSGRLSEASDTFRNYVARYPNGPEWASSQAAIVKIELATAESQIETHDFAAARSTWRSFLESHPLYADATSVARKIADSYTSEADTIENASRAELLFEMAIDELERLVQKSPNSNAASAALLEIGDLKQSRFEDLLAAIFAWRRCSFGPSANAAKLRILNAQKKSIKLATPRVLRTNEAPTVQLSTRNLTKVDIEIYKLDLESYFRRHNGYKAIADLDLDLIQADAVFTHTIRPPSPHSVVTEALPLPVELVSGPGTWVVSAIGTTQRTTTLLLISDIDVIFETHGDDAVVFAEDMLREEAVPGVSILVVQAGTILTGQTDAQGLAHFKLRQGADRLALYAQKQGHVASLGLAKMSHKARPKGATSFIYTDRGVFRAGETVHWKAILRSRSKDGTLAFQPGQDLDVDIRTPAGVSIFQDVVSLGDFGTLFGDVVLPANAPEGTYTISIGGGSLYKLGNFEVHRFSLPKACLGVDLARQIVLPGQSQTLRLQASYTHGAPLIGGRISARIGDQAASVNPMLIELLTDEKGLAEIVLSADDLARFGPDTSVNYSLTLDAETQLEGGFFLAGRELVLELSLTGSVFSAGERFGVNIGTQDIYGAATSRKGKLEVIKIETNRTGQEYERILGNHHVQTDRMGLGRIELQLDEGGSYLLRLLATDAAGQPVSTQVHLEVTPESEFEELQFFTEATHFEVGEMVHMRVYNRGPKGPALVTRLGHGILHSKAFMLQPGDNTISFRASISEAPGVAIRVSRMHNFELYSAKQRFEITRDLQLSIHLPKTSFAPGRTVDVELVVTDKQGLPVQAELSLGLVDDTFFDTFSDRYTTLRESFPLGYQPTTLGRVDSSTSFGFAGVTHEIADALLAEVEQAKREAQASARKTEAKQYLGNIEGGGAYRDPSDFQVPGSPGSPPATAKATELIGMSGSSGGRFGGLRRFQNAHDRASGLPYSDVIRIENPTHFWAPIVVTNQDGRAKLSIKMPGTHGRWRFTARGIDQTSRVVESYTVVETKADFLVELLAPTTLRGGDQLQPRARVFWSGKGPATAHLAFTSKSADGQSEVSQYQVNFESPGVKQVALAKVEAKDERGVLLLALNGTLDVKPVIDDEAHADKDMAQDSHRIDVLPFGIELHDTSGGLLASKLRARLELSDPKAKSRQLEVYIGAGLADELVEAALGNMPLHPLSSGLGFGANNLDLAGDIYGGSAVLKRLESMGPSYADKALRLRQRLTSLVAELVIGQSPDGGFGAFSGWRNWADGSEANSIEVTSLALFALIRARNHLGLPSQAWERAADYLATTLAALPTNELEARCMASFGLAAAGRISSDQLSGLWRARTSLSPAAKAFLALAFDMLGRGQQAGELAQELEGILSRKGGWDPHASGIWNRDPRQQRGLFFWAVARTRPQSAVLRTAAEGLLASAPWHRGRVRGPALNGLIDWNQIAHFEPAGLRVRLRLIGADDTSIERILNIPRGVAGVRTSFDVPSEIGPVELEIEVITDGRRRDAGWQPTWHARLTGFTNDFAKQPDSFPAISQIYQTVAPVLDRELLRTGFSILSGYKKSWINEVRYLNRGDRLQIALYSTRNFNGSPDFRGSDASPNHSVAFSELKIHFPAGCTLVPGSVNTSGASWQPTPTGLAVQTSGSGSMIWLELRATSEGFFRVPPATIRSATDPSNLGLSKPMRLSIVPPDTPNQDPFRATPDERYFRGMRLSVTDHLNEAKDLLLALFDEYEGVLNKQIHRELAIKLLELSLNSDDAVNAVRFFEMLSAIDPSYILSINAITAIGDAYTSLDEPEHAATLFTATIAEHFQRDMIIVGMLQRFAGFSPSTQLQERLWHEYPDDLAVVETRLALTDTLLTFAPQAYTDRTLVALGRDEVSLTLEAILFLREFLVLYPTSELANQAGANLLQAYTSLEDYARAAALAGWLAARCEDQESRDEFLYTRAVSLWFTGEEESSLKLLKTIADANYPSGRGSAPSKNRALAIYMMGQIHHAKGDLEAANVLYQEVGKDFPEAQELSTLLAKSILFVDEITTGRPGQGTSLSLSSKGLSEVELQVYPVDLLALLLREGDLEDINNINLAGITPIIRTTHALDARLAMRPIATRLELPAFEPGAYLTILRGGKQFATGLIVVTDLNLFVEEDKTTGSVRCEVTRNGLPLENVDIRIVGSVNPKNFFAGKTDRRGLFQANGIMGKATVIARQGRQLFAFHRGELDLLASLNEGSAQAGNSGWFLGGVSGQDKTAIDWLKNTYERNSLQILGRTKKQGDLRSETQLGIRLQDVR